MEQQQHEITWRMARQERDADKARSKVDPKFIATIADLEQVSPCPKGNSGAFFYKSKISCYNFTIIDLTNNQGYCYRWDETQALRGANEMSSARYHFYTEVISKDVTEVVEYGDTCGGQNRSVFLASALCNLLENSNISKFSQKFFESGHSQSEVDTIHSSLERRLKDIEVFRPDEWLTFTLQAGHSSGKKYKCYPLATDDVPVYDIKGFHKSISKNKDSAVDLETGLQAKPQWMQVKRNVPKPGKKLMIKLSKKLSIYLSTSIVDLSFDFQFRLYYLYLFILLDASQRKFS